MISAGRASLLTASSFGFSAIARSVMISARTKTIRPKFLKRSFSAIARSVMISALNSGSAIWEAFSFSAIARSVMISALGGSALSAYFGVSVL